MLGRSPESLPASGPQLPESLFACSFPNDNRLRSLPSPLFYYGQQLATYDNTIQLVLLFYYMNHCQSTHTFLIKLSGRRAVKRTIFRTWVHTTNYLARDFSITKLLSNRKMLFFLDKISLSVLWGSKLDLNFFDMWRTIYIGHTGCFYRQCPFPHLIQIKINNASFAFLHLLGNKDQQSAFFKERQGYYHFPFPAVMHHQNMITIHHCHCNMAHQSVSCQFFGRSWCLQAELYYHFFLLSFLAACHWHWQKLGGREIQNFFSKYMLTSQVHYISQDEQKK